MKFKSKLSRLLNELTMTSRLGRFVALIVIGSLLTVVTKWFVYDSFGDRPLRTFTNSLAVFVLSDRNAFDRRETIRKTWALGHNNVFFVVGEYYCPYPPEHRFLNTCNPNNYSLTKELLKRYHDKEDTVTRKLKDEQDVILVPTRDDISELPKKVAESYKRALQTIQAEWFLHVEDTLTIEVESIKKFLETTFNRFENIVILSSIKRKSSPKKVSKDTKKPAFSAQFLCGMNHLVSRCVAKYTVSGLGNLFEYIFEQNVNGIEITASTNITSQRFLNVSFIAKAECKVIKALLLDLYFKHNQNSNCLKKISVKTHTTEIQIENPSTYLHSNRFDLIVKMVYAYFYAFKIRVPKVIKDAYIEHIKVWNNFHEYCKNLKEVWYDAKRPCEEKRSSLNFISTFHNTIDNIKTFGFNSSLSRIPVDETGFVLNGAHRLAASTILSKSAAFDHQNYKQHFTWGYKYFKSIGLPESMFRLVMLEWMKIQMQLPYLTTLTSIVSVFSNNPGKDETMRKIVKEKCSKDNGILYETTVEVTEKGARQLITHMYGKQSWLETKIQQMLSKFEFLTFNVLFLFVYGKDQNDLVQCKDEIRKLYNDKIFKSTVHIPDTSEENLILAEMILNQNSVQFMNQGKDPQDCKHITSEIARRSSTPSIKTLPTIYLGRDDVMIDSGAVLGFFGLRQRTDVDILFLQDVDNSILGNRHGLTIQAHAFNFNSISRERAWGEDHFSNAGPKDQWDLFYDPNNYGYCYGIKFVSLQQLIRYKIKRNEPNKDQYDVGLINQYLQSIAPNGCLNVCRFSYKLYCICFILFAVVLLLD